MYKKSRISEIDRQTIKEFWEAAPELLFPGETIALILGVSNACLDRMRWHDKKEKSQNMLKYIKLGKRLVRYKKQDVLNWIENSATI